jgi:hypothetical protein
MAASKEDISGWFDEGVKKKCTHMIVVCDTYDWDDYPVFVTVNENVKTIYEQYNGKNMQKVMEVYDLKKDKKLQLGSGRVFNF